MMSRSACSAMSRSSTPAPVTRCPTDARAPAATPMCGRARTANGAPSRRTSRAADVMNNFANPHWGSTFDNFLEKEGIRGEATIAAIKKIMVWQLVEDMTEEAEAGGVDA